MSRLESGGQASYNSHSSGSGGGSGSSSHEAIYRPLAPGAAGAAATATAYSSANRPSATSPLAQRQGERKSFLPNDAEDDDYLHDMSRDWDKSSHSLSVRGLLNIITLTLIALGLLMLFLGYPILVKVLKVYDHSTKGGFNLGGTNGSGQVPALDISNLIDSDTPEDATTWTSHDGKSFHLVFSDEFEEEGRTFWPGDDPFWEAVDLWYSGTGDFEWYSPEAINTTGGALQIALTETETHNKNFQSGMLQSWNKFCFQGGYIEFSVRLPGGPSTSGYWPAVWLMGNLGRPGYQGSTQGMWPYTYQSCDTGILPNQTFINGTGPEGATQSTAQYAYNGELSYLPGMRLPACTCPGEDHPGPNVNVGRSAPELDIFEVQVQGDHSFASMSLQIAPFDDSYAWGNATPTDAQLFGDQTTFNTYTGGQLQEAVSGLSQVPDSGFAATDGEFIRYGVEFWPDFDYNGNGKVVWYLDGKAVWQVNPTAFPARPDMDIGQRIVPTEPMAIIMNLAVSDGFQRVNFGSGGITFPAFMSVDYVRVYQPDGQDDRLSCDPPDHPTSKYIEDHLDIYTNPNYTIFPQEKYAWPKNKLTGC